MNCDTFQGQIDAYADGTLSAAERVAFEEHRANCFDCQMATDRAQELVNLLTSELPKLAAATPSEQVSLREKTLDQLGVFSGERAVQVAWRRTILRSLGTMAGLLLVLAATFILLPSRKQTASAAEIVDRARAAVEEHQGMNGVLHWETEWSQHFPSADEMTRTVEIWFSFEDPGRYRLTHRDAGGRVLSEMLRDGGDRMWKLSRSSSEDGHEHVQVDEIILSEEEIQALGSWYVPSPFLDDLDRFTEVLSNVERVADIEVAGRPAYVLRSQLYGFGLPGEDNRIDPVTSTVHLVVDAETYWVLDRTERVLSASKDGLVVAGVLQRTRRFEILSADQVPPEAFKFTPPPGAEVRTIRGIGADYAPPTDTIALDDAAQLTSFTLVMPSQMPDDLQPRPHFRYQGDGAATSFGIVFLGGQGRQVFLLEYEQAQSLDHAARAVTIGKTRGWLVPDPLDAHKFSLHLVEPQPARGPDSRRWPASVELQVSGLSLDEAVAMLASLEPYAGH